MNIRHEIMGFYPTTGSLLVRYYCKEVPEGLSYSIDIPLENGVFAPKEDIDKLIEANKPVGQLERIVALRAAEPPAFVGGLSVYAPSVDAAAVARAQRDAALCACDWTQLADAPLILEEKQAWAAYRQALRDLPAQAAFPTQIIWPISPAQEVR